MVGLAGHQHAWSPLSGAASRPARRRAGVRFLQGCALGSVPQGLTTFAKELLLVSASCKPLSSDYPVTLGVRAGGNLCSGMKNNEGLL